MVYKSFANITCSNCYDVTSVSNNIYIWNNSELKEDSENTLYRKITKNCFRDSSLLSMKTLDWWILVTKAVDFTTLNAKIHIHRGSIKIYNTEKCLQSARVSLGLLECLTASCEAQQGTGISFYPPNWGRNSFVWLSSTFTDTFSFFQKYFMVVNM